MSKKYSILFLILIFAFLGCTERPKNYGTAEVNIGEIQKDVAKWYQYHYYYIDLNSDFKALDATSNNISKETFLEKLITGNYLAARLHSTKGTKYYQLFNLSKESDANIGKAVGGLAKTVLKYYRFEGKKFPDFEFIDFEGNVYNNSNTKGQVLVLKTWFINCAPCIEEMPVVNYLKKKYSHENALFIGLTFDRKEDLLAFLKKKRFDYKTVPVDLKFIQDTIGVNQYPTHIIVDRDGRISKLMNDTKSLRNELERVFSK